MHAAICTNCSGLGFNIPSVAAIPPATPIIPRAFPETIEIICKCTDKLQNIYNEKIFSLHAEFFSFVHSQTCPCSHLY